MANHPASAWPAASLLLCGAQPAVAAVLGRLGVPHFLPLYANQAWTSDARPPSLRQELRQAPTPTARPPPAFVTETLRHWQLHSLGGEAGRSGPAAGQRPGGEGGRGLLLVERLATAWGVDQHPGGGKVVWCALQAAQRRR